MPLFSDRYEPVVTLTRQEIEWGVIEGGRRHIESVERGLKDKIKRISQKWDEDIDGALGEIAFSKLLGLVRESTVNTFKKPDVDGAEVRHTRFFEGHLVVRPRDLDDIPFVLVTGLTLFQYRIVGYMMGRDAKKDEWYGVLDKKRPNQPSWNVPYNKLLPLSSNPKWSHIKE